MSGHTPVDSDAGAYRLLPNWAQLPADIQLGEVPGMTIDSAGRVFTFTRAEPPIIEFDASGNVLKTWGEKMFVWPHGIRVDRDGFLWITDGRARNGIGQQVFKFTRDGQLVMTLGKKGVSGDGPDTFNSPTDVAVAPNGDIFVSDGHVNSRIVKFSKDGTFIKAWGRRGDGPGEFNVPHTIFFDSRGRLLVGDRSNRRIQIFDQDGTVPRSVDAVRIAERDLHRARTTLSTWSTTTTRWRCSSAARRTARSGHEASRCWPKASPSTRGIDLRRGDRHRPPRQYVTGHAVKKLVMK